jgi:F420-dependent oxidoreductase-like protein
MERAATGIGYNGDKAEMIAFARRAEELGYESLWSGENWGRDNITMLSYVAAHTERIGVGTSIMNVFSRSPTLIAQTAATLDELSGGRVSIGLGTSGALVIEQWHGVPYRKPLQRTREYIEIIRLALSGERVNFDGEIFHLQRFRLAFKPLRSAIPIYVAALGPQNVELTGELADGWLPIYVNVEGLDNLKSELEAGARKAGRSLADIDIAPSVMMAAVESDEERDQARAQARQILAHYAAEMGDYYAQLLTRLGFGAEVAEIQHVRASGDRVGFVERVSDRMIDALTVIGPPGYCRERLAYYRQRGVTCPHVGPLLRSRDGIDRTLKAVAPALAGAAR